MSSRLFHSVVAVGMALGASNGGCLGRSASQDAQRAPDTELDKPRAEGSTGEPGASQGSTAGGRGSDGIAAGSTAAGSQGNGGSEFEASSTSAGFEEEPGPAASAEGGAAGMGGATGDAQAATTSADNPDPRFDPYCDAAWPTTKGSPGPPSCVDPNQECTSAGYPSHCLPLLEDGSCSWLDTQSPFCIDAQWQCAPGTIHAGDCRCWAPLPADHVCTENGPKPQDQ